MELVGVVLMIVAGGAIAALIMIVIAVAQRNGDAAQPVNHPPDRTRLAASILFNVLLAGGAQPAEAMQQLKRVGIIAPVTAGIDIANWSQRYAQLSSAEQRGWLLETAVQLVASTGRPVALRQYAMLLDLSFSLGFQTDALAKLRERYAFEYLDHVDDRTALLRILGLESSANRQAIISAYRRLASQIHPDRVHGKSDSDQNQAAAKFIEITRAYEMLMAIYRE